MIFFNLTMRRDLWLLKLIALKKDKREAIYYQNRLKRKGKDVLAYKMQKRIINIDLHIQQIKRLT